jgi:ABC-type branched-subunit amino acid transport system substrate-binding protein
MKFLASLLLIFSLQNTDEEILRKAESLIMKGETSRGIELLEPLKFSKDKKIREKALLLLIKGYFDRGEWERVEEISSTFERDFPKSSYLYDVYYLRARGALLRGDTLNSLFYFMRVYKGKKRFRGEILEWMGKLLNLDIEEVEDLINSGILSKRLEPTQRVDLILPRKGPLSRIGEEFLKGFRIGLKGPVEARVWDSSGAPEIALDKMRKIVREKTSLLIGPLTTREIESVESLSVRMLLPLFSPTAYEFEPFLENPLYFTAYGNLALETRVLAERFLGEFKRIAILYPDKAWGMAVASYFKTLTLNMGGEVVFFYSFSPDSHDFTSIVEMVVEISPDLIFLPGGGPGVFILAYQLRVNGIEVPILGLEEWAKREGRVWGERGIEDVWVAHIHPRLTNVVEVEREKHHFLKEYKRIYETEPTIFAERGYDCGKLVSELLKGGPLSALQVGKRLKDMKIFNGISGNFLLNATPGLIKISVYKKGRLIEEGE